MQEVDLAIQASTTASGPVVAIIGIGTVFVALAILVSSLDIIRWIVERVEGRSGAAKQAGGDHTQSAAENAASSQTPDSELTAVALAAYGLHRRRRVNVRPSQAPSRWSHAGRSRQVTRLDRRR